MSASRGTAQRTLEWAQNNVGAGARKIRAWDSKAGFAPGTAWCGIFLGNALRTQGLPVPSGYAAASNWSGYGTSVKSLREARPGDILVYGSHHVAMYLGEGRQIQGNNSNGTVGVSAAGSSIGLGPITAIRRPPYRGRPPSGGDSGGTDYGGGVFGFAKEFVFGDPLEALDIGSGQDLKDKITGTAGDAASGLAGDVVSGVTGDIASHAEALMLNIGLIGGGAFLVYYGAALMLGVKSPGAKITGLATAAATKGAA